VGLGKYEGRGEGVRIYCKGMMAYPTVIPATLTTQQWRVKGQVQVHSTQKNSELTKTEFRPTDIEMILQNPIGADLLPILVFLNTPAALDTLPGIFYPHPTRIPSSLKQRNFMAHISTNSEHTFAWYIFISSKLIYTQKCHWLVLRPSLLHVKASVPEGWWKVMQKICNSVKSLRLLRSLPKIPWQWMGWLPPEQQCPNIDIPT